MLPAVTEEEPEDYAEDVSDSSDSDTDIPVIWCKKCDITNSYMHTIVRLRGAQQHKDMKNFFHARVQYSQPIQQTFQSV